MHAPRRRTRSRVHVAAGRGGEPVGAAVSGHVAGGPATVLGAMAVRLLGSVDLVDADGQPVALGGPKERAVLAVLALHRGETVSEARLVDALWGDDPPRTATRTLQSYVSRLRRVLAGTSGISIESRQSGYCLCDEGSGSDVAEMERLVTQARQARDSGDHARAAALFGEAETLWRGPVLGELAGEPFALSEVSRLEELRVVVVEERVEAALAWGRHRELVAELEAMTGEFPLRERLWAARMLALYRSGRQAEALRAYQQLREHLGEELGLEPSPELADLESAILRHDPALLLERTPSVRAAASDLPTGVVTFLLTDIEGSTAMWEQHPAEMSEALARHDEIIQAAVTGHGGRLVKAQGEGDSTFSVFTAVSNAATAALAAQRGIAEAAWPEGVEIRVRMALHMGEALERDGDYFGPAVNRVARLRGIAVGGEILVSRSAAEVLTDHTRAEWQLADLGDRELPDLSRPERVWRLGEAPAESVGRASVSSAPAFTRPLLAGPLAAGTALAGRGREEELLGSLWARTGDGEKVITLVSGEPGIGKTALVGALARKAYDGGAVVVYGRCDEDVGLPYQPFAEAARSLVAALTPSEIRRLDRAGELVRLVPDLSQTVLGLPAPLNADADAERWVLFEAFVELLGAAAKKSPVLLVADDLHWAGKPTLLLLRHLVRSEDSRRLMIVGTYRDTDVTRADPLSEALADLRRERTVTRVALHGLDVPGVEALLEAQAGHDLDDRAREFAAALHHETQGNPFFVLEVLQHLVDTGVLYEQEGRWTSDAEVGDIGLPEGIREVVGRRLSHLSDAANRALTVAAIAGPSFELRVLEAVPDAGEPDTLLDALEEAAEAGLLTEERGTFSFSHALVRQTLVEEISSTRRGRLHRQVGEAIEALPDKDRHVEALAHHFAEAALDGQGEKAARYALGAAEVARSRASYEDAARLLERGLEALDAVPGPNAALRCDLLIDGVVTNRMVRGWATPEAAEEAVEAATAAQEAGLWDRFVNALDLYPGFVGETSDDVVELLGVALANAEKLDAATHAHILASKAGFDLRSGDRAAAEFAADRAIELATAAPSPSPLVLARCYLAKAGVLLGSHRLDERQQAGLAAARAFVRVAPEDAERSSAAFYTAAPEWRALWSVYWDSGGGGPASIDERVFHILSLRDRADVDELGRRFDAHWEQTRSWASRADVGSWAAVMGLLDGRWEDVAEALVTLLDRAGDDANTVMIWGGLQMLLHRETGRGEEFLPATEAMATEGEAVPALRLGAAALHVDLGHAEVVADVVRDFAEPGLPAIPRDQVWGLTLAVYAELIATVGDQGAAGMVLPELALFEGLLIDPLATFIPLGPADRFLGMLATTLGRFDDAERYFVAALEYEVRLESRPFAARTRLWYARMLRRRGDPGDEERARKMAADALADAEALGMPVLADQLRELLRPGIPAALAAGGIVGRDAELAELRSLWERAGAGDAQTVLVVGEPGIGKTALVGALAQEAHDSRALVLYGRCDEDVGLPYQPFAEAARALVAAVPADDLAAMKGVAELVRLVPDLAETVPDLAPPLSADADAERWVLFEAFTELLATAAKESPVLLVADDLHWARKPTLLLLRHLVRSERRLPLMVVGTYRDTDVTRADPLSVALADLRRERTVTRVTLHGLDVGAVEALLEAQAGHDLDDRAREFAGALHRETQGNPFFVLEVLQHLVDTGVLYEQNGRWTSDAEVGDIGLPEGIREVVGRRLSHLSDAANQALTVAAIAGPSFELRVLEAVPDAGEPETLLDALEEAAEAGLLTEERGTFSFSHALVRQTLVEEISSTRRGRLHRQVAEALEALPDRDRHIEALAHHFAEAALDGQGEKAARYALAVAAVARSRASYEDAARLIERGLEALEASPDADAALRCDLLIERVVTHRMVRGWATPESAAEAVEAATVAQEAGLWDRFVHALDLYPLFVGGIPEGVVELLDIALANADQLDDATHAHILANKAGFDLMNGDRAAAEATADRALELATAASSPSPLVLARCYSAKYGVLLGSHRLEERRQAGLAAAQALARVAPEEAERASAAFYTATPEWQAWWSGYWGRGDREPASIDESASHIVVLRDRADVDELGRRFDECWEQTRSWAAATDVCYWAAVTGLLDGRWEDVAEALATLLDRVGDEENAVRIWGGLQTLLHRETGRGEEFLPVMEAMAAEGEAVPALRLGAAVLHAELGHAELVAEVVRDFAEPGLPAIPRDLVWGLTLAVYAELIATVDDQEAAGIVWPELVLFEGLFIDPGATWIPFGPADRLLGMLATTLERFDDAERSFDAALDYEARLESRPFATRTRLWYARMLLRRGGPGDEERARTMATEALADAEALEMPVLADQLREVLATPSSS